MSSGTELIGISNILSNLNQASDTESANQENSGAAFFGSYFFIKIRCVSRTFSGDRKGMSDNTRERYRLASHQQPYVCLFCVSAHSSQQGGCRKFGTVFFFFFIGAARLGRTARKTELEERRCLGWGRLNYRVK